MNEIVKRFRLQKKISKRRWFEIGKDKGLDWAKNCHYEEIQMVIYSKDEIPMEKLLYFNQKNERWFDDKVFELHTIIKNSEPWKYFMLGFIKGVQKFWDEVKYKI